MAPRSYSTWLARREQLPKGAVWRDAFRVHAMTDEGSVRQGSREDAIWIPAGRFRMGSDRHYPEEAPSHLARVDGFWIDR